MDEAIRILSQVREDPRVDVSTPLGGFQLRPTLLDPIVPELLGLLTTEFLKSRDTAPLRTIYVLSRVRGYKLVLQHFPVSLDLVPILLDSLDSLGNLEPSRPSEASTAVTPSSSSTTSDWQAQYALLLWASAVVLAPFDLSIIGGGQTDVHHRVARICTPLLSASGIQRDAAALLMARLLTRSRTEAADEAITTFSAERNRPNDSALHRLGTLQVMAIIMDRVVQPPSSVRKMIDEAIEAADTGDDSVVARYMESSLTSALWIKILGRAALQDPESYAAFAITEFLTALDANSTNVRTAAAKYLARIAQHIGANLSADPDSQYEALSQVWESVAEPLQDSADLSLASPDYWSGALFALAEMVRRLPSSFWRSPNGESLLRQFVVSVLRDVALHFVQDKIRTQGGASVRDTACYVCWAIFRYVPELTPAIRDILFGSLMALAVLDAEVHVRRAAAAALQEGLGRQTKGLAPTRVFEIMEAINFHSVSQLSHCYLMILPQFWEDAWIPWLLLHGCFNSNPDNRRLAAEALPLLKAAVTSAGSDEPVVEFVTSSKLIDALLAREINSTAALHGQCICLSSLYASGAHHRADELVGLVRVPSMSDSEMVYEAMLRLAVVSAEKAVHLLTNMKVTAINSSNSSTGHTQVERASPLVRAIELLVSMRGSDQLVQICAQRLGESPLFVAALVRLSERFTVGSDMVRSAMRLANPESRAWACNLVNWETADLLIPALNDYAADKRGDIGSWVREAALKRVTEIPELVRDTKIKETAAPQSEVIQASIWRMAAENNQRVRQVAGETLVKLSILPDLFTAVEDLMAQEEAAREDPHFRTVCSRIVRKYPLRDQASAYFYVLLQRCPENRRADMIAGLITSIGGARGSVATLSGSFRAFVRFLPENPWILESVLNLRRDASSGAVAAPVGSDSDPRLSKSAAIPSGNVQFEVLRALKRLAIGHISAVCSNRRVLAVAFNTSLMRGLGDVVMGDAIDILQSLAGLDLDRVRARLLNIVRGHPSGAVRQRAADAVYELDLDFSTLADPEPTQKSKSAVAGFPRDSEVLDSQELQERALTVVDWKRRDWRLYTKYLK